MIKTFNSFVDQYGWEAVCWIVGLIIGLIFLVLRIYVYPEDDLILVLRKRPYWLD